MNIYSDLLDSGWTLNDIDNMDIMEYIEIMAYRARKKYEEENKLVPIDQVLW